MNRIILIGNGFDLAHGLKTSYKDFILEIWKSKIIKELANSSEVYNQKCENSVFSAQPKWRNGSITKSHAIIDFIKSNIDTVNYTDLEQAVSKFNRESSGARLTITFKNKFLESLFESHSAKGWVDVEEEYYKKLKKLSKESDNQLAIKELNRELEQVKDLLDEYLQEVATSAQKIDEFDKLIYSSFLKSDFIDDIPMKGILSPILDRVKDTFMEHSSNNVDNLINYLPNYFFSKYYRPLGQINWDYIMKHSLDEIISEPYEQQFIKYCAVPNDILFLNFNYTPTAKH